jgi:hypothetical protein
MTTDFSSQMLHEAIADGKREREKALEELSAAAPKDGQREARSDDDKTGT